MNKLDKLLEQRSATVAEMNEIAYRDDPGASDSARFVELERKLNTLDSEITLWKQAAKASADPNTTSIDGADSRDAGLTRDPLSDSRDVANFPRSNPWNDKAALRHAGPSELKARALSASEVVSGAGATQRKTLTAMLEDTPDPSGYLARQILLTTDPDYIAGWSRLMMRTHPILTNEQAAAVQRVEDFMEERSMSLTDSAGGYLVPAQLDPTIIITGDGTLSDIAQVAKNVTAVGDTWLGVSAAQVSASWDGEVAEVSDDAPTIAQPSIPIHKSQIFVPFSIEIGMDGANFTQQITDVMADGQMNLEATAFTTGTGTDQPTGIVTALTGGSSEIASNATDVFSIADAYDIDEELPARYRRKAKWMAHWRIYQAIREAAGANLDDFWANLNKGKPALLLGNPALICSEMDGVINASAENYVLILGDWSNYVIARRLGFTVELIPHLFSTGNNRPDGRRGLYGYARIGADSVADGAFRMLNVT